MGRSFILRWVALLKSNVACLHQALRRDYIRKSSGTWKMLFTFALVSFCGVSSGLSEKHIPGLSCLPAECFHITVYCRLPLVIPVLCEWELDRGYLGCIAPGPVIKFTDEISESLRESRPKPGELDRKCWAAHFATFFPHTGLMLLAPDRWSPAKKSNGCKGGRGLAMEVRENLWSYWLSRSAITNLRPSHERKGRKIIKNFLSGSFSFSAHSTKY